MIQDIVQLVDVLQRSTGMNKQISSLFYEDNQFSLCCVEKVN